MKNNIIKYLASAAMVFGVVTSLHAIPIVGSIGFNGSYTQDGTPGNLTTATQLAITPGSVSVTTGTTTGDFVGAGAPLSFASPIGVNGSLLPIIGQLWSVTVGLRTFTMTVSTEAQTFTSAIQLNLAGTGIMSDGPGGLDDTLGTWQLGFGVSGTPPNASFTWQSTSAANNVPDGGTTVMLLGAALSGFAMLRRKLA